jgi:hypothetical protein
MEYLGSFSKKPEKPAEPRPMHICGAGCGCELVSPLKIDKYTPFCELVDLDKWHMILLCPDCEYVEDGVYTTAQIEQYALHRQTASANMRKDAKILQRAPMEEWVDRFVTALYADLILPEDF